MINFGKYLIPTMEAATEIPSTIKVSFFGKTWDCKLTVDKKLQNDINLLTKILNVFKTKSVEISKDNEFDFVSSCGGGTDYEKYSEIPNLSLNEVKIDKSEKNGHVYYIFTLTGNWFRKNKDFWNLIIEFSENFKIIIVRI